MIVRMPEGDRMTQQREWRARADLNCRPLAPQASALSGLSYGRDAIFQNQPIDSNMRPQGGQADRTSGSGSVETGVASNRGQATPSEPVGGDSGVSVAKALRIIFSTSSFIPLGARVMVG